MTGSSIVSAASGFPKQAPSICDEPRSCIATESSALEAERFKDPWLRAIFFSQPGDLPRDFGGSSPSESGAATGDSCRRRKARILSRLARTATPRVRSKAEEDVFGYGVINVTESRGLLPKTGKADSGSRGNALRSWFFGRVGN